MCLLTLIGKVFSGRRGITVRGRTTPDAFSVYDTISYIKVNARIPHLRTSAARLPRRDMCSTKRMPMRTVSTVFRTQRTMSIWVWCP